MKKTLALLVLFFLIASLNIACTKQAETTEAKTYIVKTYTVDWDKVNLIKSAITGSELVKQYAEDMFVKKYTEINTYYAKEIISFAETSIRFIDYSGKEIFISADFIETTQQ